MASEVQGDQLQMAMLTILKAVVCSQGKRFTLTRPMLEAAHGYFLSMSHLDDGGILISLEDNTH